MKITEVRSVLDRQTGNHDVTVSVELTPAQGADPVAALHSVLDRLKGEPASGVHGYGVGVSGVTPEPQQEPEASTSRRRRSSSDTAAPAQEPVQAPADDGVTNRRRRTAPAPEPAQEPAQAAPAEGASRRRRATTIEAPPAPIEILDLIKAASNAASNPMIGPDVVMEVLKELGVSRTDELKGDDRQKFLDAIAEEQKLAELEAESKKAA